MFRATPRAMAHLVLLGGLTASVAAPFPSSASAATTDRAAPGAPLADKVLQQDSPQPKSVPHHPRFVTREQAARDRGRSAPGRLPFEPIQAWPDFYTPLEDPDRTRERFAWLPEPESYRRAVLALEAVPGEGARRLSGVPETTAAGTASSWAPIGTGIENGDHDWAGRLTELRYAFDDTQGMTTLWAGTVAGGLWKFQIVPPTGYWMPVSDALSGSPSVGSFLVRASDSHQILVGTGDVERYPGTGIYRTTDAGGHWAAVPLPSSPTVIYRMQEDFFTDGLVLAATNQGLLRSANFGASWATVAGLSLDAVVTDVVQDPDTPEFWYAAASGGGIYLSADAGLTFTSNTDPANPVCMGSADALPGFFGRAALAVSANSANFVFALVENGGGLMSGLYRSADYGCHWTSIDAADMISWGQAQHAHAIGVDPDDADRLFVGMAGLQYTENATAPVPCWVRNVGPGCVPTCGDPCIDGGHADFTSFLFVPDSVTPGNTTVLIGNDGGYFAFDWAAHTIDGTGNRLGLQAIQIMQPHQAFAAAHGDPNLLLAGLQDNGLVRIRTDLEPAILYTGGGDGGQVSVSPDDPTEWHASSGAPYGRLLSTASGAPWIPVNCSLGTEWAMSMQKDPTPGFSNEVFTYGDTETARVTGVQNLATTPLAAAETLTVVAGSITTVLPSVSVPLTAGWGINQVRTAVDGALIAAGMGAATVSTSGALRLETVPGGADQFLRVTSNLDSGPGTAGFGTGGISDFGTDGFLRYKPVSGDCDWSLVNPGARLPVAPIFHPKQVDQANNTSSYLLYSTAWFDQRLLVFDGGAPGSMTWQDRTPPLLAPTSACSEGFVSADRSNLRPRGVYYTTGCTRPSQALFSNNAGLPGSWFDLTGNLATLVPGASFWELVGDPTDANRFFLGTSVGVFRTDTAGAVYPIWYRWRDGLPAVVDAMGLELASDGLARPVLRIATYGRGFWQRTVETATFLFADGFESGTLVAWGAP